MRHSAIHVLVLSTMLVLCACKAGFNQTYTGPEDEDSDETSAQLISCFNPVPSDSGATEQVDNVLQLLVNLSCENDSSEDGILAGQNIGSFSDTLSDAASIENALTTLIDGDSENNGLKGNNPCLLYTSPSPRDA